MDDLRKKTSKQLGNCPFPNFIYFDFLGSVEEEQTGPFKFTTQDNAKPHPVIANIAKFEKLKRFEINRSFEGKKLTLDDIKRDKMTYEEIKRTLAG